MLRPNGISTLIACQNEEVTVGWSILGFLEFSDEIIIVDNGSTDASKDICRQMQRQYPERVQFHDVPHLKDVYENRQYALERSRFRWITRADADYICYTSGEYDCKKFREHLLSRSRLRRPCFYKLFQPTLYGDFWHTGTPVDMEARGPAGCHVRRGMKVVTSPMPRIYQWYPGLKFGRFGRTKDVSVPFWLRRLMLTIHWPTPIWMECTVKSESHMLYRSERTNWRDLGDFERYPDLDSYLRERIKETYGTDVVEEAARLYAQEHYYPHLAPYDPGEAYPYPDLIKRAMEESPTYRLNRDENGTLIRTYEGVNRDALSAYPSNGKNDLSV